MQVLNLKPKEMLWLLQHLCLVKPLSMRWLHGWVASLFGDLLIATELANFDLRSIDSSWFP